MKNLVEVKSNQELFSRKLSSHPKIYPSMMIWRKSQPLKFSFPAVHAMQRSHRNEPRKEKDHKRTNQSEESLFACFCVNDSLMSRMEGKIFFDPEPN
jgi:hypothetical protein